jgi:hypothetical protein
MSSVNSTIEMESEMEAVITVESTEPKELDESPVAYVQDADGKYVLTPEAKAWSTRLYYAGRLAYNKEDTRFAIGRYNEVGEVVPFALKTDV